MPSQGFARLVSTKAVVAGNFVQIGLWLILDVVATAVAGLLRVAAVAPHKPAIGEIHGLMAAADYYIVPITLVVAAVAGGFVAATIAKRAPLLHGALSCGVMPGFVAGLYVYSWFGGTLPHLSSSHPLPVEHDTAALVVHLAFGLPVIGLGGGYLGAHIGLRTALRWVAALVVSRMAFNVTVNVLSHVWQSGSVVTLGTMVGILAGMFIVPAAQRMLARNVLIGLFVFVAVAGFVVAAVNGSSDTATYGLFAVYIATGCVIVFGSARKLSGRLSERVRE